MRLSAQEFKHNRQAAYRAADKGELVEIMHDRYPDKIFELTARDKEPLKDDQQQESQWPGYLARINAICKRDGHEDSFSVADIREAMYGVRDKEPFKEDKDE